VSRPTQKGFLYTLSKFNTWNKYWKCIRNEKMTVWFALHNGMNLIFCLLLFYQQIFVITSFVITLYTVKWKVLRSKQLCTPLWCFVYRPFRTADLGEYRNADNHRTVTVTSEIHTQVRRVISSANPLFYGVVREADVLQADKLKSCLRRTEC
jgi:hypothetical protein